MKRTLLLVLCATLSLAISVPSTQAGTSPKGKPFISLNNQIVEVSNSVTTLQGQIDNLLSRVDTMEEYGLEVEDAITTLTTQNETLIGLVNMNLTSVDSINSEISLLQQESLNLADMGALQESIDANNQLISDLQAAVILIDQKGFTNEDSLEALIANNTELIGSLQAELSITNDNLALKQNLINGNCPDGSAVQKIYADGSVVCGAAGGGASGQMETVYVWSQCSSENKILGDNCVNPWPTSPGQKATVTAACPEGYAIMSAGYNAASGWELNALYTVINPNNGMNYSITQGFNRKTTPSNLVGVATCTRIAP